MDAVDWLLGFLYAFIAYAIVRNTAQKNNANSIYTEYYVKGFLYKLYGAIGFTMIYLFYYKGGDSINFFYATKPLYGLFWSDTGKFFEFIFSPSLHYPQECVYEANSYNVLYLLLGKPSLTTIRIGALLNLACFNYYVPLSVLFAFFSYTFQWKTFQLLSNIYPNLRKQFFYAFFMVPSVAFWGSSYAKDTITLCCIFQLFYSFYYIFILRRQTVKNVLFFLLAAYIISSVRGFILFSIIPCLILMAVTYYRTSIQSSVLRYLIGPLLLLSGIAAAIFVLGSLGDVVESYSMDSLQEKAEGFRSWHTTQGGSSYSIAEDMEYTPTGVLKNAPLAIVTTLFGPFFWQIGSLVMLLSAIESIVLLYLFVTRIFFNRRVYGIVSVLFKDHIVMFCIPFIVILATAIGLTSFNYGALVRYRIPVLPFFVALFFLVNYHLSVGQPKGNKVFR